MDMDTGGRGGEATGGGLKRRERLGSTQRYSILLEQGHARRLSDTLTVLRRQRTRRQETRRSTAVWENRWLMDKTIGQLGNWTSGHLDIGGQNVAGWRLGVSQHCIEQVGEGTRARASLVQAALCRCFELSLPSP
jgi:hypothetical protein